MLLKETSVEMWALLGLLSRTTDLRGCWISCPAGTIAGRWSSRSFDVYLEDAGLFKINFLLSMQIYKNDVHIQSGNLPVTSVLVGTAENRTIVHKPWQMNYKLIHYRHFVIGLNDYGLFSFRVWHGMRMSQRSLCGIWIWIFFLNHTEGWWKCYHHGF